MSLYERVTSEPRSRSRETAESMLIYGLCFSMLIGPVALRRLFAAPAAGRRMTILDETRTAAANCAASSFMGL